MRKRAEGFSLVELLIVIVILGVLAALVIAGVSLGRRKANDNTIRNDVRQARLLAETVFNSQGASYENWTTHSSVTSQLAVLQADVDNAYGGSNVLVTRDSQVGEFCISAPLLATSGHYCVDRSGTSKVSASACPNHAVDGPPLVCP